MIPNRMIWLLFLVLLPFCLNAQGKHKRQHGMQNSIQTIPVHADTQQTDMQQQMKRLRLRLKKLEEAEEKKKKQARMQQLLDKAKKMSQEKKSKNKGTQTKFVSGIRQQSAMNPNISLGGDHYVAWGTSKSEYNRIPSETSWGTGKFMLREMEMALQAALDPYSRAKVYLSFGTEGVVLEEGYMQWLNLPIGMQIKLGQIKTQFGKINRYHDHALPQFERPLVLSNFFGHTSLKGLGMGVNFLLPGISAHVNELDVEVITGGVDQSFTSAGKHNLIGVAHYKNYYDLSRSTYLEVGFSGALGHNDPHEKFRTVIGGTDLTLKWSPPGRSKYRGVEWRTEALLSNRETQAESVNSRGFFSSLQFRLNSRWLSSLRLDYSQMPHDSALEEWGGAFTLDYWQTEFVFLRLQATFIERNFDESDLRLIFQTSWAMGPHKHEAY